MTQFQDLRPAYPAIQAYQNLSVYLLIEIERALADLPYFLLIYCMQSGEKAIGTIDKKVLKADAFCVSDSIKSAFSPFADIMHIAT
jgi:hypothetical protein